MGWVKDDEIYKKETTSAVPFYFYFTDISLITRAGLPTRTTLSPKDLVITDPAPATTLFPSVTPGRTMTPPPAQKLSPIVIGLPYSTPELRSCGSNGWRGARTDSWGQS